MTHAATDLTNLPILAQVHHCHLERCKRLGSAPAPIKMRLVPPVDEYAPAPAIDTRAAVKSMLGIYSKVRTRRIIFEGNLPKDRTHGELRVPITTKRRFDIIVRAVAFKHGVTVVDIKADRRAKVLVIARHEAFYRLSQKLTWSLTRIGRAIGDRDHTTIIHGIKKHKERMGAVA